MRCFIAIEPADDFADELVMLSRQLERYVAGRFVPADNYHVTLAFLGDVDERSSQAAIEAMREACVGAGASADEASASIPLIADGLGKFGRANDATLWLGLGKVELLMSLASRLRDALKARGVGFDERPFVPHITLARRVDLRKVPLDGLVFPEASAACALTLFKSTLTREGASYKPLFSIELPKEAPTSQEF